jgi:hypothetical protein
VIDKGIASAALIAQVIVDKYADHLPLYRQEERFRRAGIDLDRSTLAGWVGRAGALLEPLVQAIRSHVMAADKLHADDTTAPTLKPGNSKTLAGRYWNYVRDDRPWAGDAAPAVWFQYSTTRSGKEPAAHLKGYCGIIQCSASTILAGSATINLAGFTEPMTPAFRQTFSFDNCHPHTG